MPCHLSKIQGLRWQGGSLKRGCLAHREIAGYRLLHRGHPLITIFTHPLNISITSMLKTMNTRKIAFSTPSQPPHGDLGRKEGLLEPGVYGQKDYIHVQCRRIERVQSQLPRPQTSPALPGHNPAEQKPLNLMSERSHRHNPAAHSLLGRRAQKGAVPL